MQLKQKLVYVFVYANLQLSNNWLTLRDTSLTKAAVAVFTMDSFQKKRKKEKRKEKEKILCCSNLIVCCTSLYTATYWPVIGRTNKTFANINV